MSIIYLLTNKENGKRYVGKTTQSFDVRWGGHVGSARRGDNGMLICRAIKKHGPKAFRREVLQEIDESELPCSDRELGELEMYWIKTLGTHVSQGGYNLTFGGDGGLPGYTFSIESREKIRQKALGRKHSEATRMKMSASAKGHAKSPEAVESRARSNRGKKRTEEQKARMKAGQLEYYRKRAESLSQETR